MRGLWEASLNFVHEKKKALRKWGEKSKTKFVNFLLAPNTLHLDVSTSYLQIYQDKYSGGLRRAYVAQRPLSFERSSDSTSRELTGGKAVTSTAFEKNGLWNVKSIVYSGEIGHSVGTGIRGNVKSWRKTRRTRSVEKWSQNLGRKATTERPPKREKQNRESYFFGKGEIWRLPIRMKKKCSLKRYNDREELSFWRKKQEMEIEAWSLKGGKRSFWSYVLTSWRRTVCSLLLFCTLEIRSLSSEKIQQGFF